MKFVKHFIKIVLGLLFIVATILAAVLVISVLSMPLIPVWFRVVDGFLMICLLVAILTFKGD